MPQITSAAIKYFQASNLDVASVQLTDDMFGTLPCRFPNAWHVLSLLGKSSDREIACELSTAEPESMDLSKAPRVVDRHSVILSGIDPTLDSFLANTLRQIEHGSLDL